MAFNLLKYNLNFSYIFYLSYLQYIKQQFNTTI
jgi:hypothetical protein